MPNLHFFIIPNALFFSILVNFQFPSFCQTIFYNSAFFIASILLINLNICIGYTF